MKCRVMGDKKVLYIPAELRDAICEGNIYGVMVNGKVVGLKCVRVAGRKVLHVPKLYDDLFRVGEDYTLTSYVYSP